MSVWKQRLFAWGLVLLFPLVHSLLSLFGYKRLSRWLLSFSPHAGAESDAEKDLSRAFQIASAVNSVAHRGLYRPSCLERSLVLWWILVWQRIPSDLRIGVRAEGSKLLGHAWIECHGIVVNDSENVRDQFAPFAEILSPNSLIRFL